jgi:hypothetical protein
MLTNFSIGRRYLCTPKGRAHFYFTILGPGPNYADKPSKTHKLCRIDVLPDHLNMPGGSSNGSVATYSHSHLKKYGKLVEVKSLEVKPGAFCMYAEYVTLEGETVSISLEGENRAPASLT